MVREDRVFTRTRPALSALLELVSVLGLVNTSGSRGQSLLMC